MKTVAVVNHKGGVGKTTTAVCLSGALVKRGKRILLLDLDPQASASKWLEGDDTGRALVDTLLDDSDLLPLVCQTPSGIDLIPCGVQFAGFDRDAGGEPGGEFFLRQAIERLPADAWDFLLLDCPPSLNLTSVSALVAADVMLGRFPKKNFPHQAVEAGRIRISHLGNSGWRSSLLSTARIAFLPSVMPF